jgi:glycine cleavage system aminomethyltransferase T
MDAGTGEVLVDSLGRRSFVTSIAYGPSVGKNIALGYLPREYCEVGRELLMEYFLEQFPIKVEAVGYRPLYDPENTKPKS